MKLGSAIILFLLCIGQVFTASSASNKTPKEAGQQKTASAKTPPSMSRLSKPIDVSSKTPSGTLSSEEIKKLEAEKQKERYRHARSHTLPVFNFPLPKAHVYKPEQPVPITYIKAPTLSQDDIFVLYQLVSGYVCLHAPFAQDEAERVQDKFLKAIGIQAPLEIIYKKAAEIARMRAQIAQRDNMLETLQIFTTRAAECDESAKKAAAVK